ncbi:SIT4 phosphatase-associated protein-domain-containing protein [Circinella umbellata]|nr:SIT4 phosphatase-associated protein-domain-containing protein [Circinella umbellata]
MFWRFGFHNPSAIDTLLEREDIELEDILEEEDLLQEAKSHNQKLVDYFCKPENLTKLLNYITATDLDESRRFKYPFLACEIMACEIPQIVDSIVLDNKGMLGSFWEFLDRPAAPKHLADEPTIKTTTTSSSVKQQQEQDNDNNKKEADIEEKTTDKVADQQKQQQPEDQVEEEQQQEIDEGDEEEVEEEFGLDSLQAQYFCKTISVFLTKRTTEVLDFIKSKPKHLEQILTHLQTSAIMDLLLTLVRVEELAEGKGIVQWLSDNGLLDSLVDRLDPYLDSEEHSVAQQCICEIIRMSQTSLVESPSIGLNDLIIDLKSERVIRKLANFMLDDKAPNSTSTLINGVTIIIDLIRHNNSDMDNDPMLNGTYGYNANPMIRQASVSLADMLRVLADHVGDFNRLLLNPRSVNGPMRTTLGEQVPLGFERLKICELFAELLHCSNMSNLNSNVFDDDEDEEDVNEEKDDASSTNEQQRIEDVSKEDNKEKDINDDNKETSVQPTTTSTTSKKDDHDNEEKEERSAAGSAEEEKKEDLSIGDYLKIQFVEHHVMPTCINLFFAFPWNNFLHYVIYDMLHQVFNGRMDKGYNRHLAISVFKDGKLTDKMVQAQKANDEECAKPKGMRLGYMGHLTFIADEIIKLFEGYPEAIVGMIKDDVDMDAWNEYCNAELKDTKERDRLPLAGPRPNDGMDGVATDEEEEEEEPLEDATAGQYSRYLGRHGPDGDIDDDEDEEHENWITGRDDYDREYYGGGAFGMGNNDQLAAHHMAGTHDELEDDEEYGSDDDEESGRIPQDWTRGFAPFPQTSMLHRTQSHISETEDADNDDLYKDTNNNSNNNNNTKQQQTSMTKPNDNDDEDEDDPFGDFTSSDNDNNTDWSQGFTSQFEKNDPKQNITHDYVRAVKTKEEEGGKLAKDYRPEEEQQGEI